MIIATLNIDWAKSQNKKTKIENILNAINADILIITEGIDLNLPIYSFIYKTHPIPIDKFFEGVEYSKLVKNNLPYRVSIYSTYECTRSFAVSDSKTSICKEFNTAIGPLTIYATIIGTLNKRQPYAGNEIQNCINDCLAISKQTEQFCLAGDLNTSFLENEETFEIPGIKSRMRLLKLCEDCKLDLTTKDIKLTIDHILLSKSLQEKFLFNAQPFVEKKVLSDHQGILVDIRKKIS